MNKHTHTAPNDVGTLAADARALMVATANVAGEKVGEVRKRLADALESAKAMASRVSDKAVDYAKATDEAVHAHPYPVVGAAFAVGALLSYLVLRRGSGNGD